MKVRPQIVERFTDIAWLYEKQPPNGGAPGDAYNSALNGTGFDLAQLVAREAIQNSVDAANPASGGRVNVEFRIVDLKGAQRREFETAARLADMRERFDQLALDRSCCIARHAGALRLLYVEDRNTTGLSGSPARNDSNFRKLLMNIGLSDKIDDEQESGGSYGLGKSVYSGNSRIRTIFAFSRTTDAFRKPITILMGCAYQRHHEFDNTSYTGRAWLGRRVEVEGEGYRMDPAVGEEAEVWARALGFGRGPDDLGTSILIVDSDLETIDIVRGVEDYWWPRIIDDELEVDVIDENGKRLPPKPIQRAHLKPFIAAWNVAIQRSPPVDGEDRRSFQPIDGQKLGELGIVTLAIAAYGFLVAERARFSPSARAGALRLDVPELPPGFQPRGASRARRTA